MEVFSVISIVCIPPVIIGGLFGMNIPIPMQWDYEWEAVGTLTPFWILIGVMAGLMIIFYLIIRVIMVRTQ
jgi:Mg2+ and Co2+ transporter CorA